MNRLLLTAFSLVLLAALPAAGDDHKDKNDHSQQSSGQTTGGGMQGSSGAHDTHHGHDSMSGQTTMGGGMQGSSGATHHDRGSMSGQTMMGGGMQGSSGAHDTHHGHDSMSGQTMMGGSMRGHGHPMGSLTLRNYHRNFTAPHHFQIGAYHAPAGYHYRRWHYGERLPRDYFIRDFWLTDFFDYGLETPPDGYVWVRYGPDALLIDEDTGEVVEVEYGVFY